MIKELIKIANRLDSIGRKREADAVDGIIRKIATDKDGTFNSAAYIANRIEPESSSGQYIAPFNSAAYIANRIDPRDINPRDDSDVSIVFRYIIAAAKETPGVENPYYQIIGGRDIRDGRYSYTLASNILNLMMMNWNDFKSSLNNITEDVIHEQLMDRSMKYIADLPDGDLDKENFYKEIDRIKSVLGLG